jgi:Transposase DDE domain
VSRTASIFSRGGWAGDTVYGAVWLLKWLVDHQITPHIPVWDKSARSDGTFSRTDFVFDRSRNTYICPNGKLLHTTGTVIDGSTLRYASKRDCDGCAFKMQCCPHTPARQIPRDLHEDARDVARALAKTEAFEQSRRERKKVEMCFAHIKLDRLRLRGLSGAKDEVATDRNRAEPAASRQVPLPAATTGSGVVLRSTRDALSAERDKPTKTQKPAQS